VHLDGLRHMLDLVSILWRHSLLTKAMSSAQKHRNYGQSYFRDQQEDVTVH